MADRAADQAEPTRQKAPAHRVKASTVASVTQGKLHSCSAAAAAVQARSGKIGTLQGSGAMVAQAAPCSEPHTREAVVREMQEYLRRNRKAERAAVVEAVMERVPQLSTEPQARTDSEEEEEEEETPEPRLAAAARAATELS